VVALRTLDRLRSGTAGDLPLIRGSSRSLVKATMRTLRTLLALLLVALAVPAYAQVDGSAPAATAGAAAIPLTSPDSAIEARLVQLYHAVDGLDGVRPTVRGGVVTLAGTTLDIQGKAQAAQLAGRVTGVVAVSNRIAAEHRLDRRLAPLVSKTEQLASSVLALLPLLVVAVLAFTGFWLLGRLVTRSTALFERIAPNPFLRSLAEQVIRLLFILAGLVVAMSILGATALLGSVLGAAGVLGLAVGFAVRDTIENYIASVLLSIRQPFAPNDLVIIEGFEGRITRLNSRATIVTTSDGNEVRIPNATVYKANIINLTHTPERKFEFEIRIALRCNICTALAAALKAAREVPGVLREPEPGVVVDRLDPDAVVLTVSGWVDQARSDFGKVKSEAIRSVKDAFDAERIVIAEPVQLIRRVAVPANEDAADARQLPAEELRAIRDTRADKTIERKVRAVRAGASEDLLTKAAARE
jgi:small conductance mechanosensitive channel